MAAAIFTHSAPAGQGTFGGYPVPGPYHHSAFTTVLAAWIFVPAALSTAFRWVPENNTTLTPDAAGGGMTPERCTVFSVGFGVPS